MLFSSVSPRWGSRNKSPTGPGIHGFTLVELLVVIAIISIIAGFLIPTLLKSREEADKLACKNNLREIARLAMIYADSSGKRFFPFAKGSDPAAHDSLNVMVDFFGDIKPAIFQCPTWRGGEIEPDTDGKYTLDEDTLAYTWTKVRLLPSESKLPLSSDKYIKTETQLAGHEKGMNVAYPDSSVQFVLVDALGDEDLPNGLTR